MSADPVVVASIKQVVLHLADLYPLVDADMVRKAMPHAPYKRSTFGAAFRALKQEGRIILVGYAPSKVPDNHGRTIKVWRAKERCA